MVNFKHITCLLLTQTFNINLKQKLQKYSLELRNKICIPSSSNSWGIYILNTISCVYTTCQSWLENLSIKHNLYILLNLWLHANKNSVTTAEKINNENVLHLAMYPFKHLWQSYPSLKSKAFTKVWMSELKSDAKKFHAK